ncbi:MAG TPA: prepilin-type N-terminal cleavage/methylation domain-containing protein [Candidatus Margulisiibacteriota bacterium]|nr:prepilin-type N-terminal cleavage/methylation domain-containing protein [Candidatus Margulisiibacteriota bacterium]
MNIKNSGVTLVELVVSVVLMSLLVLSYFQIDNFSRLQVLGSDRKAKLQSEVSICLEQLTKDAARAIGDINSNHAAATVSPVSGDYALRIWVDSNPDGMRIDDLSNPSHDQEVAYRFTGASGASSDRYQVWYYPQCVGANCDQAGSVGPEVLSRHIVSFAVSCYPALPNNNLDITISARWDPENSVSIDNPAVNMRTRLTMPAVSNR